MTAFSEAGESGIRIAVVGATGLVGGAILEHLASRSFPITEVVALASEESLGKRVDYGETGVWVDDLKGFDFGTVSIVLFAAPAEVAAGWVPKALSAGCRVIDSSKHYRLESDIPLVVASVNADKIKEDTRLVSLPGSVTEQITSVVSAIKQDVYIQRLLINTFESVSSHGREVMKELASQTVEMLNGKPPKSESFPRQVAFNLLPVIGELDEEGVSEEENSIIEEIRRIFDDELLPVDVTAVQAPVFFGNSSFMELELAETLDLESVKSEIRKKSNLKLSERGKFAHVPSVVTDAAGSDSTVVGRLRLEQEESRRISAWIVSDNVRSSAAKNSVEVCEVLLKSFQ